MKLTKTAAGALLTAGVLALSACGGDDSTATTAGSSAAGSASSTASATSTDTASASAGTETPAESSSSADSGGETAELGSAEVGDKIDAVALGEAMTKSLSDGATGHMKMDLGGQITAEGDFEVEDGKQNTSLTMDMAGNKVEVISMGGVTYMKGLTGGTKWVKSELGDAGAPSVNSFDPAVMAKAFAGQQAEVTAKDGDTTTYSLELDLTKITAATGMDLPTGVTMPETIPVAYVLDGDNRLVKTTMNMGAEIVVEYSDWGKKVDIEAPPASEVTTM